MAYITTRARRRLTEVKQALAIWGKTIEDVKDMSDEELLNFDRIGEHNGVNVRMISLYLEERDNAERNRAFLRT